MNYKVRRQNRLSSSENATAEALAIRGRSSNRKGRGDQETIKVQIRFQKSEKNQCALCKELRHWRIDCPKAKDKKKESKTEVNLTQVVSTHASTSQADG